jgi:predicted nucleic acid-binding protein
MNKDHPTLVDSNVFIDDLRQGIDPMRSLLDRFPLTDLVTCGVVKAEVLRGVKSLRARDRLAGLFEVMRYVQTSDRLWDEAWQLAWTLDRQGRILPLSDLVIASCALKEGARVLTSDRHFDHIPNLHVLRP